MLVTVLAVSFLITTFLGVMAWLLSQAVSLYRPVAMALFLISAPLSSYGFVNLLGLPQPLYPPFITKAEGYRLVLGKKIIPGDGMYVMLDGPTRDSPPRLYKLPWSEGKAEAMQSEMSDGNPVEVLDSTDGADESEEGFSLNLAKPDEVKVPNGSR